MMLLKAEVKNFGSYKQLEFSYENQGLCLISGPTGSGKSTFEDIASWILFGTTSKNVSADGVRTWGETKATIGNLWVKVGDDTVKITRIRGSGGKENDLYLTKEDGIILRGIDSKETQKIIENKLKITKEEYLLGACYNEFSSSGYFFNASAKERKSLFERIANLDIANKLSESSSKNKKETKLQLDIIIKEEQRLEARIVLLNSFVEKNEILYLNWETDRAKKLKLLEDTIQSFEKEKESRIQAATTKFESFNAASIKRVADLNANHIKKLERIKKSNLCITCGKEARDISKEIKELEAEIHKEINRELKESNPWKGEADRIRAEVNPYTKQYSELNNQKNPYEKTKNNNELELKKEQEILQGVHLQKQEILYNLECYEQLYGIASVVRATLLDSTIKKVNDKTNYYINTYFDGEIQVDFVIGDGDSLDTNIRVNGNECSYAQLSKGQRGLLKLCFATSIMEAIQNKTGIRFNTLFFDEALDGLDAELKIKAFNLFSELEKDHETILVIDHSNELKLLFNKKYSVCLGVGGSELYER